MDHIRTLAGSDETKEAAETRETVTKFIFNWIVHMIQRPFELPNCALSYRSEEGVGKSMFWQFISRMIGERLSVSTSKLDDITGKFNGLIEGKLLILSEEADTDAKSSDMNVSKELITGKRQTLQKKGIDQREIKHYGRIVYLTNNDMGVRPGIGDRHYVVMESDSRKMMGEKRYLEMMAYFEKHEQDIFNWLANWETDVKVTDRDNLPYTPAKGELIMKIMSPPIKFIIDRYKNLDTDEKIQFYTKERVEIRSEEIWNV